MDFDLRAHTHLLVLAGSRAHGTACADSDVDVRGIAIPPASVLLGAFSRFTHSDAVGPLAADLTPEERDQVARSKLEGTVFALAHWVRLAVDCNPNALDVLFCREEEVRRCTPIGAELRARRRLFVSERARRSYLGYARDQLARLQRRKDPRHAAHLVRLLRMGVEIVTTGEVHVWRGGRDADELRAIRDGTVGLDEARAIAEALIERLQTAAATVPPEVDRPAVEALVVRLHRASLDGLVG